MATSETSGRSSPSRSRLMPTSTSNSPLPQGAQDLHPLDGVNLAVQVLHVDADLAQVIRQFLGRALGERRHQHPLLGVRPAGGIR